MYSLWSINRHCHIQITIGVKVIKSKIECRYSIGGGTDTMIRLSLDKYIEQWTMKYNNLRIHTEMDASLNPPTSTAATGKPHQSTLAITLPEAERYLQSQDLRSIRYAEYVYTALDSFGVEGATSLDLKVSK